MRSWHTKSGYNIMHIMRGRCNVFLLRNKESTVLIDSSTKTNWKKLNKTLKSLGMDKIDYLILTHAHHDHAANAAKIRKNYSASVIIHQSEAALLEKGKAILPRGSNVLTRTIRSLGNKIRYRFNFEPCPYEMTVNYICDLKPLGINGYIMHTPGHSAGSISVIVDDEIAVVGDALFGVFREKVYPPYADDPEELVVSWKKLLSTECKLFLPAHGSARSREQLLKGYLKRVKKM